MAGPPFKRKKSKKKMLEMKYIWKKSFLGVEVKNGASTLANPIWPKKNDEIMKSAIIQQPDVL